MGRAVITPSHNSLLSDYYPPEVRADVTGSTRSAWRSARSSGLSSAGCSAKLLRLAAALLRVRDPTVVFVILASAARAGPGPLGTRRSRRERGSDRDRRGPAFVRGVDPHPLADRNAAAHLVLAAVPRGVVHRPRHAHVALLRAGVPSRRLPTRRGGRARGARRRSWRSCSASRSRRGSCCATRRRPAHARGGRHRDRRRVDRVRARTEPRHRDRDELLVSGLSSLLVPGIFAALSLTIPPKVRAMGFAMAALFIVPGLLGALYRRRHRRRVRHCARACSSSPRSSSSARGSSRRDRSTCVPTSTGSGPPPPRRPK